MANTEPTIGSMSKPTMTQTVAELVTLAWACNDALVRSGEMTGVEPPQISRAVDLLASIHSLPADVSATLPYELRLRIDAKRRSARHAKLEALVWKHAHADFRGKRADGTRCVLHLIPSQGTCSVPLSSLSESELLSKLHPNVRCQFLETTTEE